MEDKVPLQTNYEDRQSDIQAKPSTAIESRLLLASASGKEALAARLDQLAAAFSSGEFALDDFAYTLARGRKAFSHRAAVVVSEEGDVSAALRGDESGYFSRGIAKPEAASVAMMFPGQGAQFVGMGRQLYFQSSRYREIFDRCDSFLTPRLGTSLRDLLLADPDVQGDGRSDSLKQTAIAQPALFVVEYGLAEVLKQYGVVPEVVLGHSIGEYAAACLAGIFDLEAALELVSERGRLMQSMPPGGMLAVKVAPEQLVDLLGDGVDLAAHNAPGLSVVSGAFDAVARFEDRATERGYETTALHTSHAFHSEMMDPILEEFERVVERAGARPPNIPLISTMTGASLTAEEAISPNYWAKQLRHAVRFADAATTACSAASRVFLEVGPGVSLVTSVSKLVDVPERPRGLVETLGHPKSDMPAMDATLRSLGQLWIHNAFIDVEAIYGGPERRFVRLPTYPYRRQRHWISPPRAESGATAGGRDAGDDPDLESQGVPPEDSVGEQEQILARVVDLVGSRLGRELNEDDSDKKFLELGFDSLALSQLVGKLRQEFKVRVAVRQLFEQLGTPSRLAEYLAAEAEASAGPPATSRSGADAAHRRSREAVPRTVPTAAGGSAGQGDVAVQRTLTAFEDRLARIEKSLDRLLQGGSAVRSQDQNRGEESGVEPSLGTRAGQARAGLTRAGLTRAGLTRAGQPLTASQREIWMAVKIGGEEANLAYNECRTFLFEGRLDVAALDAGLQELARRHEALRQTFSEDGERCLTHATTTIPLEQVDLRNIDQDDEKRAYFADRMHAQVEIPFDLARGPLIRGSLIRLEEEETALLLCAHHVAVDGSSWEILIRELAELYSANVEGRQADLPSAEPFSGYRELEQDYRHSAHSREDEAFWLEHLRGQTQDLNLPVDRPRPAQRTFASTRSDHHLPASLVANVRSAATSLSCTSQTFLFAAFQLLLFRLTRQTDFVCGVPTSGQAAVGKESLVGHCVHVLPLRFLLTPERSIQDHIRDVHGVMMDGLEHQRATFTELLPKLERVRDVSRPALIQAAFGMGRSQKKPSFAGLDTALRVVPRVSENFELYVYATEDVEGLEISWSYNTDLFERKTIELWQRCFETLLTEMVRETEGTTISEIDWLSSADRQELLELAHGPRVDREEHIAVHRAIFERARQVPLETAIIDQGGAHTYRSVDEKASQIGHFLARRGFERNALVAVCLDRTAELVSVLLGVWRAGLGYVPLDPDYPAARVQAILEDSRCALVLTNRALVERIPDEFAPVCLEDMTEEIETQPTALPDVVGRPDDTAYVIFTSGSTGRPKGVQISQAAFENFIFSMQKEPGFSQGDCLIALTTVSFDISGLELFLPLVSGGKMVLVTRDQAINPRELQRLLRSQRVNVMQATPATWQMLFESSWEGDRKLKVLCGGEAFPRHLAERFLESCGEIWNMYGPTETTVWSAVQRVRDAGDLSIGRPIDNTTLYVLDEHRALVPKGVPGELWIGGAGVAQGYWGRPELTAERFVPSPFVEGERIYRSGDLARLRHDGKFECLGRVDDQVKIRGFRIELGEVESALLKHPDVGQCAVVAREGQSGEKVLAGYLVPSEAKDVDVESVRGHLTQLLPAYMLPSAYCVLDALPMTPNKKVDRKALPTPRFAVTERTEPTDDIEAEVLEIWSELLGNPDLGTQDNFYSAGGHSLLAIRLIERVNANFRTLLPVNELFNHPTVEGLSSVLRDARSVPASVRPAPASVRTGVHQGLFLIQEGSDLSTAPPLFLVHGDKANGLLVPELGPEQEFWGYHHQGSDGERVRLTSVEALATRCHEEWIQRKGHSPCVIGGHSFGALVAYHVAVLRERAGLETPRLVLIDSRHPSSLGARNEGWGPTGVKRKLDALRSRREDESNCRLAERYLERGESVPLELRQKYIMGTYRLAAYNYSPPLWQGDVEIIRSEEWSRISPFDYWERSAVGSIRRVIIEGTHLSIVRSPEGIARVGRWLRKILEEVAEE